MVEDSEIPNQFLTKRSVQPDLRVPLRRSYPGFSSPRRGLVSLAGFGQSNRLQPRAPVPSASLSYLELQAERSVAQFIHQQALLLRGRGDYQGAAKHLAGLIQKYPFYPLKLEAMAQRIDCLLKAGDVPVAKQELNLLKNISPQLASIVERRWSL